MAIFSVLYVWSSDVKNQLVLFSSSSKLWKSELLLQLNEREKRESHTHVSYGLLITQHISCSLSNFKKNSFNIHEKNKSFFVIQRKFVDQNEFLFPKELRT